MEPDEIDIGQQEYLQWVRVECLRIACRVIPESTPKKQIETARLYEGYVLEMLADEAVH